MYLDDLFHFRRKLFDKVFEGEQYTYIRGYRMPYAKQFNGYGLEASTSLELLPFDKTSA